MGRSITWLPLRWTFACCGLSGLASASYPLVISANLTKLPLWPLLIALLALWIALSLASVAWGAVSVAWPDLWAVLSQFGQPHEPELAGTAAIIWQVRVPRVLLAGLAGLGLAVAGVAWQGVLRNPLADPYLIGASAGAALGAAGAILFGIGGGQPMAVPLLAFLGSLGAVALVYRLALSPSHQGQAPGAERLLLAGVAVSAFLSAVMSLAVLVKSDSFTQLYFWLVGGLSGRGWEHVGMLAPYALVAIAGLAVFTPRLNLLQLGEETAFGLGVDVARDRRWLIGLAALLTAAIVSVCGMIGFVGLVVPHLARLLVGQDLRRVMPVAAGIGACLLVGADLAARLLWAPLEIPVGILTALAGAPFFLYLLGRRA